MLDAEALPMNWDQVTKFTPELYQRYMRAPIWQIDSPHFTCEADYEQYWCQEAQRLVQASKAVIGRWQQQGKQAAQALESAAKGTTQIFDFSSAVAVEPLPYAKAQVQETVALLSTNPGRPLALPQQESQHQYVSAMNQLMEMVLEDNNYDLIMSQAFYDAEFWKVAILKWTVNKFEPGIFAQPGKITLEKITPDEIYFDPKCKQLHYSYMDYCIQRHVMEIGEIMAQYPLSGEQVSAESDEVISDTSVSSRNNEDYIQSPQPKLARDGAGIRQKITVLEVWIKDSRMAFEPELIEGKGEDYKNRFKVDDDGYIIGTWKPRYPNGRLLVVTGNHVLKDLANPYPHGQFPFMFMISGPSQTPYAVGDAVDIMTVTRKINDTMSDMHAYYQSEIKRPMHADAGAIQDPNLANQIPNDPTYVVELAPGKRLERRMAQDIPPGTFTYLGLLKNALDNTSGSSGVMTGNIDDGSQMSAEAIGKLQSFASSRLALKAKFANATVKQCGYQLMWILRATVPEKITVNITKPDGTPDVIDWESDRKVFDSGSPSAIRNLRAKEDYLITVRAGTGKPGAQEQQQSQALELFRENAITREALLDSAQWPGRQRIVEQMRKRELEDIESKAIGREIGIAISESIKQDRPGRRKKS